MSQVKTKEQLEAELAKAKTEMAKAERKVEIEMGEDYDVIKDNYTVPEQLIRAFPNMNFHYSSIEPAKLSKKRDLRYQIVHIPDTKECKELLDDAKLNPYPKISETYGNDVWVRGDCILMMCPKTSYDKRKTKLADMRKARTLSDNQKNINGLKGSLGSMIKDGSINVSRG